MFRKKIPYGLRFQFLCLWISLSLLTALNVQFGICVCIRRLLFLVNLFSSFFVLLIMLTSRLS